MNIIQNIIGENTFLFTDKDKLIKDIRKEFLISICLHWYDEADILGFSQKLGMIKRNLRWYFMQNPMPFWENFKKPEFIRTEDINKRY